MVDKQDEQLVMEDLRQRAYAHARRFKFFGIILVISGIPLCIIPPVGIMIIAGGIFIIVNAGRVKKKVDQQIDDGTVLKLAKARAAVLGTE